ncbi:hypothetical protein GMRT_11964 [Giardia muris]|uniref:J domain-containing protein n=1 Tax=Giardia muris TaxID=5742 RepID=A0A4Z1T9L4_GIAMU|nr:hypothetical protein GMRT_11964 [Giardia muris]|eukprot:TNJ29221.1 hypothetical protein GMRT_11964 [Giardia muris]
MTLAYRLLDLPPDSTDDTLISVAYKQARKRTLPENASVEDRDAFVVDNYLVRLAYNCVNTETRRTIYQQVEKAVTEALGKLNVVKRASPPALIDWSKDDVRSRIWEDWAKTIARAPVGFKDWHHARWLDPVPIVGGLDYLALCLDLVLGITLTVQFQKPGQDATSIETMRIERKTSATGASPLNQETPEQVKEGFTDFPKEALSQIKCGKEGLRCTIGTLALKDVELTKVEKPGPLTFDDRARMELTSALIYAAATELKKAEIEAYETTLSKFPNATNMKMTISNIEVSISPTTKNILADCDEPALILHVPVLLQPYRWDQTPRYALVNLLTGNMTGTSGISKSKQGLGKIKDAFKSLGRKMGGKGTPLSTPNKADSAASTDSCPGAISTPTTRPPKPVDHQSDEAKAKKTTLTTETAAKSMSVEDAPTSEKAHALSNPPLAPTPTKEDTASVASIPAKVEDVASPTKGPAFSTKNNLLGPHYMSDSESSIEL